MKAPRPILHPTVGVQDIRSTFSMSGQGTLVEQSSSAVKIPRNQRNGGGKKKRMKGLLGQQTHQPTLLYSQVGNGRTQLVSN